MACRKTKRQPTSTPAKRSNGSVPMRAIEEILERSNLNRHDKRFIRQSIGRKTAANPESAERLKEMIQASSWCDGDKAYALMQLDQLSYRPD